MNNNFNQSNGMTPIPIFDPFPKPNTIPDGWDLSEISTADKLQDEQDLEMEDNSSHH